MRETIKSAMFDLRAKIVDHHKPCKGSGWLESVIPGRLNPCECMIVFHYLNSLIEAKIPRDYWWLGIDDLEIDDGYKKLCRWYTNRMDKATSHALGIMFLGANGIGKTSMQCAIGKEAVVQGYHVQYFTAQQYIEARKNNEDNTLVKEFESGNIILLDEMDKVYIKARSNFVTKTLEDFMRRKTADGTAFIVCTNHDAETLSDVFGQSTMSMLRRHLRFVDVEGDDYSDKLQDRWGLLMDADHNYYAEQIMTMATRMMDRELEEDDLVWKEAY